MANDTICVVGVSGFVGSHVAAELLGRGYGVHGTLRDPSASGKQWINDRLSGLAKADAQLTLHPAELGDKSSLYQAMSGCTGVIMCAGAETQEPQTIELMVGAAENILDNALDLGIGRAVFTSSTGSTNPPDGEPALKNELDHWSDPAIQIAAGKFSPAAKTLMDRAALSMMEQSEGKLRVSVLNPSMITGPAFQDEPVSSLRAFQKIIRGERMSERIPNGSMSMIDVRDLAKLHVNALEQNSASGRYFGVKQSWHWRDILNAIHRAYPDYSPPAFPDGEEPIRPTQFDLGRQRSLGVDLRDLDAMIASVISELTRRRML
ncbi:MAG: NAD-dependent epimerase/dehydratase family protein [Pseudomonadaceae bacterium]|nr:NAD-dependent epimerase/dehydratase family protein [Pseudomonadaceae bacterium]